MKNKILFSFFILGIFSVCSQTLIFRELVSNFYGNELFSSLMWSSWLIWIAIGSFLFSKLFAQTKPIKIIVFSHIVSPFILFFILFLIRTSKTILQVFPGQAPNLLPSIFVDIFSSFPLAFLLGVYFPAAAKELNMSASKNISPALSKGYVFECLGFLFGGIAFSLFLSRLNPLSNVLILSFLSFSVPFVIFLPFKKSLLFISLMSAGFSSFIFSPLQKSTSLHFERIRFKNQNLIETRNSPLSNISVTAENLQYNFYQDSILSFSSQKGLLLEAFSHLPLLWHKNPKKIMVIGGNPLIVSEILKHTPKEIYFLEIDPELISLERKYLILPQNKKIKILNSDARFYLKNSKEKFDVIFLNIKEPNNISLNRFYTQEFFEKIKEKLNKEGIFCLLLPFSPSFPNEELRALNVSLYKTLKSVFLKVKIFPKENIIYLAQSENNLVPALDIILERWQKRNIKTKYLTEGYLRNLIENSRNSFFGELFEKSPSFLNLDLSPKSYLFANLFWLSLFSPKLSRFLLNNYLKISYLVLLSLFLALIILTIKTQKRNSDISCLSMFIGSFSFFAFEILVIFLYQVFAGNLYRQISIIIAIAMSGLALGTYWGEKYRYFNLKKIHLSFAVLFLAFILLSKTSIIFFFMAIALAGFFCGNLFSLSNKIYLSENEKTGFIYAVDSLGAAASGFIFPVFLIPALGISASVILLCILNLWALYFV